MQKLSNKKFVKKIPFWWMFVPFMGKIAATFYPYIYLPKSMLENLNSENPEIWNLSVLIHEEVHLKRQKEYGLYKWCIKYFLNKNFRLEEELIAIEEQMIYLHNKKQTYPIEYKVKQFNNSTYLWLTTKDKARKTLEVLWDKVQKEN